MTPGMRAKTISISDALTNNDNEKISYIILRSARATGCMGTYAQDMEWGYFNIVEE